MAGWHETPAGSRHGVTATLKAGAQEEVSGFRVPHVLEHGQAPRTHRGFWGAPVQPAGWVALQRLSHLLVLSGDSVAAVAKEGPAACPWHRLRGSERALVPPTGK